MDLLEAIENACDAVTVRRVDGDPVERDGTVVIPAADVQGGGGGGTGSRDGEEGGGAGWGLRARPVGAWVLRDGTARWEPALDVNRMVLGGQVVMIVALWTVRTWLRRRR